MISLKGITKQYNNVIAVNNVSVDIFPGEITGLMGPNGAGKTTLIRVVGGLTKPDSGTVHIGETNVIQTPVSSKELLGIVHTENILYPKLTLEDHLEFLQGVYKIPKNIFIERKNQLYAVMNFTNEQYARIEELSYGNQKKAALCTSLLHDPQVLLLDEPLNGLDPISSKQVKEYIKHLTYNKKKTTIISSHIVESMEKLCNRILIIKQGQIIDDLDNHKLRESGIDLEDYFLEKIK